MRNHGISRGVVAFYRAHRRELPWRNTADPYAVWVSEIMLQQTRVATVIPYYERWLARFPTVEALAAAPLDDVLAHWSGLGYYSRARNLHRGAGEVVARWNGALPAAVADLRRLPGIGRYTAGAIASLAFGRREPIVDGNVARVLARVFAIEDSIKSAAGQRRLWQLAADLVPEDSPGDFNQGLMELGATVCTAPRPRCEACPLSACCDARAAGRERELPVVPARVRDADKPQIAEVAAWVVRGGRLLLAQRPQRGLYGGLWELPGAGSRHALIERFGGRLSLLGAEPIARTRRALSHRRLTIEVWPARLSGPLARGDETGYERVCWHRLTSLGELGLSSATRDLVDHCLEKRPWQPTNRRSSSSSRVSARSSRA